MNFLRRLLHQQERYGEVHAVVHRRRRRSVVEDLNGGGVGGRWTILHAMADWRDAGGGQKADLIPGSLFVGRGTPP